MGKWPTRDQEGIFGARQCFSAFKFNSFVKQDKEHIGVLKKKPNLIDVS